MFSNEKIVSDKFKVISIEGYTPSKELINNHLATIEEIEAKRIDEIDLDNLSVSSMTYLFVKSLINEGKQWVCVDVSSVNVYGLDWIFAEINQPDLNISVICDNTEQIVACDETEIMLNDKYYSDCIEDLIVNFRKVEDEKVD